MSCCSLATTPFSRVAARSSAPRSARTARAVAVTASAESDLKKRQAEARAWVTPWLESRGFKSGGGGGASSSSSAAAKPKKPKKPASAASAEAAAPEAPAKPAGGKKVKGGEVLADGSVMYRF